MGDYIVRPRDAPPSDFSWSSVTTDLLLQELARRQNADSKPECGSTKTGSYDTAAHTLALLLILTLSTLACGFPLLSRRKARSRHGTVIFFCQHLGTGVLIATAFVHLLPTAFTSLTDPCLPDAFSKRYRPMAGLVAMVSALAVVAVESYLTGRGAGHSHTHHQLWDSDSDSGLDDRGLPPVGGSLAPKREHRPDDIPLSDMQTEGLLAGASPLPGSTPTLRGNSKPMFDAENHSDNDDNDDDDTSDLDVSVEELAGPANPRQRIIRSSPPPRPSSAHRPNGSMAEVPNPEEQQRLFIQVLLLEAGILFHSIFIGMAISVAQGSTFVVLLVAISIHQSFEGLALGSRIAAIHFPRQSLRPWLMVLAFGCTTPLGQAIGLFVHELYDPKSQAGLLVVGFMNAISSGLLLFAGLVQLLAADFLSEKSHETLPGKKRLHAYLAVVCGALLMAGVRAFA